MPFEDAFGKELNAYKGAESRSRYPTSDLRKSSWWTVEWSEHRR